MSSPRRRPLHRARLAAAVLALAACGGGAPEVTPVGALAPPAIVDAPPPPAPDYDAPSSWAARPDVEDGSDRGPPGSAPPEVRVADVFFVHPTTFHARAWNAAHDDPDAGRFVDELALPHQAAAFRDAANVWAPRYRQATIWTFTTDDAREDARRAMDLAYSDVLRAFDTWARGSADRPIIVAAHSQGSYHALRLLHDRFARGDAMRERLVAAYLVGIPIPRDALERTVPSVPLCDAPRQTGCLLSWNTVLAPARPRRLRRRLPVYYPDADGWESTVGARLVCTNPIDVRADGWTERAAHRGGVLFVDPAGHPIEPRVDAAAARARCVDGVLEVDAETPMVYRADPLGRRGDLHLADYPLFFLDVRADARARTEAHLERL